MNDKELKIKQVIEKLNLNHTQEEHLRHLVFGTGMYLKEGEFCPSKILDVFDEIMQLVELQRISEMSFGKGLSLANMDLERDLERKVFKKVGLSHVYGLQKYLTKIKNNAYDPLDEDQIKYIIREFIDG